MRSASNFRLADSGSVLTSTLLVAVSLLSMTGNSEADEPVDEAAVRRLVARLDADRKSDRQAAETKLIQLGPAVLNWLPEPRLICLDRSLRRSWLRERTGRARITAGFIRAYDSRTTGSTWLRKTCR